MKLGNVKVKPVFSASGARNITGGKGWWFHKILRWCPGYDWSGTTFTAKTVTIQARTGSAKNKEPGNMCCNADDQPREWFPRCIKLFFFSGHTLNAVGLNNFGLEHYLTDKQRRWKKRKEPWVLSFMAVTSDPVSEVRRFVELLKRHLPEFAAQIIKQLNISCPNTEHDVNDEERVVNETLEMLDIFHAAGFQVMVKLVALMSVQAAKRIADHPACVALVVSNTIPWGKHPQIKWWRFAKKLPLLFGKIVSPLAQYGGGGLAGPSVLKIVGEWIIAARAVGITKPIIMGNGIQTKKAVDYAWQCGASGIEIGSIGLVRPWRLQKVVRYGLKKFDAAY